jgi:hypothetical protein
MSQAYQRRSAEEWLSLVDAQQKSGLSGVKFCEQNDIRYASFCKWRQRYSAESNPVQQEPHSDFLDLRSMTTTSDRWHITLSLGNGVQLTLSRG